MNKILRSFEDQVWKIIERSSPYPTRKSSFSEFNVSTCGNKVRVEVNVSNVEGLEETEISEVVINLEVVGKSKVKSVIEV